MLKLRREQRKAARNAQLALELPDDERPMTQHMASSRYEEPTLFE
jgi:hypothetical protein